LDLCDKRLAGNAGFLEAELSCSITVLNTDFNYLDVGISLKYGTSSGHFKPFFGIALSYLKQYNKSIPDKCLLGISIGLLL